MQLFNNIFEKTVLGLSMVCFLAVGLVACSKDKNPPQVSEKSTQRYQLPQGNASFDNAILDYFNRYNSYILYKFSDIDFNYQLSYNLASPPVGGTAALPGPVIMRSGDSIAIQSALDFMEQYWFSFYPEDFKKKYLPQKILLAGLIYNTRWNNNTKVYDTPRLNPVIIPIEGIDHLTLPKIDTAFNTYALASKLQLKAQLNRLFLKHLMYPLVSSVPALVPVPADFFKVSDYSVGSLTKANQYKYGYDTVVSGRAPNPMTDILAFLDTICAKPKASLDAYMLNPTVDVQGLTRKKYNLLVDYFKKNYNIDIQAIGNKQD